MLNSITTGLTYYLPPVVPFSILSHQHLVLFFFMGSILNEVRWNHQVVLIFIFLMSKDIEKFCDYWTLILGHLRTLFVVPLTHFITCLSFRYFLNFLYIVDIDHLSGKYIAVVFSRSLHLIGYVCCADAFSSHAIHCTKPIKSWYYWMISFLFRKVWSVTLSSSILPIFSFK